MYPFHTLPNYFLKIHYNIIFPCTPRFSEWYLPLRFSVRNFVCISNLSHACYIRRPSHPPWFDRPDNVWCSEHIKGYNSLKFVCLLVCWSSFGPYGSNVIPTLHDGEIEIHEISQKGFIAQTIDIHDIKQTSLIFISLIWIVFWYGAYLTKCVVFIGLCSVTSLLLTALTAVANTLKCSVYLCLSLSNVNLYLQWINIKNNNNGWEIAKNTPCSVAVGYQPTSSLHPEDGGSKDLRNVNIVPQPYTASLTRKLEPEYSQLWKLQNSQYT
jgi:hypothetical protein